jgi:signal transduction histidine kinase/AmiR/NasT family two-component response regulator
MTFIASIADHAPTVQADAKVSKVDQAFRAAPRSLAFAVCVDQRIVGVIEREAVAKAMLAGFGDSAIGALMLSDPMIVDASVPAQDVCRALLADRDLRRDAYVVTRDGAYLAVGLLQPLVERLLDDRAARARGIDQAVMAVNEAERIAEAMTEHKRKCVDLLGQEFRGPLSGVVAMAELLQRQPMGADALAQVNSIRASGEALLRLLNDSMDLTKAEEGLLDLFPEPVLLRAVADRLQDSWAHQAQQAGVSLLVSYDGDPDVQGLLDPARLLQVFDNLIGSALSYTRSGAVEASLKARREGEDLVLEGRVRDTGPGLAPAKLACIFERPDVASGEGRRGSSDLTMALTRELVECMRGAIRAESNVGQGVTIVFDLIAPVAHTQSTPAIGAAPVAAHILVVDDNATNRMVAEALVEMFDCTSESVEDGIEAVEAVQTGRFDLILMDIKMPRMDGLTATKTIRALDGAVGQTPIVALTANVDPEDARAYVAAGMCCVVEKPIKPERLLQAINTALDQGQAATAKTRRRSNAA